MTRCGLRRVRVVAPFNFPVALDHRDELAALVAGNTVVFKPSEDDAVAARCSPRLRRGRVPPRRLRPRPRRRRGRAARWSMPTSTASRSPARPRSAKIAPSCTPDASRARRSPRWAAKNPAIVTAHGRPRQGGQGRRPRRLRPVRAEVQRVLARDRRRRRCTTTFVERLVAFARGARRRRPGRPRRVPRSQSSTSAPSRASRRRSPTAGRDGTRPGRRRRPELPGHFVEPTVVGGLPRGHASRGTSCSCRSSPSRASPRSTRRSTEANDIDYGLTAGIFSEDDAEVEEFFDRDRGRRRVRQPPRRARPPAPGPASSPSAGGSRAARPARAASARTTSSSSCASRAAPSSPNPDPEIHREPVRPARRHQDPRARAPAGGDPRRPARRRGRRCRRAPAGH